MMSEDFPEDFFKMKVLPELLKSVEFGGGGPKALGVVIKVAAQLTKDEFDTKVMPAIIRLFANPDRAIRVCLLDNLQHLIDRLPQKAVNDKIFPQVVAGFSDAAPVVREQTVKSVLVFVTKLSDRTINGELLRYLAKTANDEQPGIRTNTTICLGKIAKNLGSSSRAKVLIAAFTRSLRDPFNHARNAALMALAATHEYFTTDDIATRIMPAVCPLLIDKEKLVRDQAATTMEVYMQKIRKAAAGMPDTALPPASTDAASAPRMSTPQPSEGSSWAGWAISSFTNKLSSAAGDMQTNGTASGTSTPRQTTSPAPDMRKPTSSASSLHRQAVKSPPPVVSHAAQTPASSADDFFEDAGVNDNADAWGDMGDEDTFFDTTTEPTTARPTSSPSSKATPSSATPFDDGSEPDFAGWLAAQAQKKSGAKKPLPKGLTKSSPSSTTARKPVVAKSVSKPTVTKKIDMKPKDTGDDDDGWGDGW